jgi:hypothetical protein
MAPVVHGLEARYSDRIDFVYLDIDDPRTAPFKSQLGYLVQPHIFMLDGQGEILQQWLGMVSEADLEAALLAAAP